METVRAIGIDLGTTNTVVAAATSTGHTAVLRTREGEASVPSVVLLGDDRVIVGREAQLRGRAHPERVAACVKLQLGQPFYNHRIGGEVYAPEVLQACVLNAVKREWLANADEKLGIVIAVPAHFNEAQRHAVAMAAEMAGIPLLELVNEPVAAALAFLEHTPFLPYGRPSHRVEKFLIFDMGGYTLEATVVSVEPGHVSVIATEFDSNLGGHDWDMRLVDFLAETLIRKCGKDPRSEPSQLEQFIQRAGQVKLALSARSHTSIKLSANGEPEKFPITREQFEEVTEDLTDRALAVCERALKASGVDWSDLGNILLVGGATRMPMLRQALAKKGGRYPSDQVCPEEAVARGAAIYAMRVHGGQAAPPTLQVTSVSTHSLGIEGVDPATGKRLNKVLIPKGTPLPATASREFVTKSSESKVVTFNILEGEDRDPAKCVTIGKVVLKDLPADISDQWPIEIRYEYSTSGRLTVDARVRYTDRQVQLVTARPGGVSQAHVLRWKEVISAPVGLAEFRKVRTWERAADAQPPLVIAGIDLPKTPAEESEEPTPNWLQRFMPFVFRRSRDGERVEEATAPSTGADEENGSKKSGKHEKAANESD